MSEEVVVANESVSASHSNEQVVDTTPTTPLPAVQEEVAALPPAYEPNLKYKAFGKDHDIDPLFKDIIKDADTEKKVKEIFEKAAGLDHYKSKIESTYQPQAKAIEQLSEMYQKGDMDGFFGALQIPEQTIFDWVAKKLQYMNLPAEQKAQYDKQRESEFRQSQLQQENSQLRNRAQEEATNARSFQLEQELVRPEIKSAADVYEQVYGPGSFKREVVQTGYFAAINPQGARDLTAPEAVAMTIQRIAPLVQRFAQAGQPAVVPAKPFIPNVTGRSGSPAKQKITSIKQLQDLANSME